MAGPIYRKEAQQAFRVTLEGEVVALVPPSTRQLMWMFAAGLLVSLVTAWQVSYTRYAPASGVLAPREGLITISAPFKGDMVDIQVQQGQAVRAEQVLGLLKTTGAGVAGPSTYEYEKALLKTRKAVAGDLLSAKRDELQTAVKAAQLRAEGFQQMLQAARAAEASARQRAEVALAALNRQKLLVDQGYLAAAGVANAEQTYLASLQAQSQSQQTVAQLLAEATNAQQAGLQAQSQLKALVAQNQDTRAVLDMEESRLHTSNEALLQSPLPGKVVAIPATLGPAAAGAPLFIVAPQGPLYAHLMLTEAAWQQARPGQRITMRVQSQARNEAQVLKGTLESLASAPVQTTGSKGSSQGYPALVLLDAEGVSASTPLGGRVEARLQTETSSLLGWIFSSFTSGLSQASLSKAAP